MKNLEKFIDLSYSMLWDWEEKSSARHMTFLTRKNRILSIGRNRTFHTHPICKRLGYRFETLHSECDAILKIYRDIKELGPITMVNVRLSTESLIYKRPILRKSRPCINCMKLIADLPQIKNIYYSTDEGFEKL